MSLGRASFEAFESLLFQFNPDGFVSGDLDGTGFEALAFFDEFSQGIDHFAFSAFSQITKPEREGRRVFQGFVRHGLAFF